VRACALVGLARATYYRLIRGYRHYRPVEVPVPQQDRPQPAALDEVERAEVVEVLTSEEHAEKSVVQAYWAAFDAGQVACSQRTFYRIAKAERLVGDRRPVRGATGSRSRRHAPAVATAAVGDLWSWDVTELSGPGKERYFLYLILDVFSRYPVGWCIQTTQITPLAIELFTDAIAAHGIPGTVHADNGSIQRAHDLVTALHEQDVVTSYSRPRVSDDNPFSESLFKTVKYDPACPERFDSLVHAREWTAAFMHRYTTEHRHSALGRHTPAQVHYGTAAAVQQDRQRKLDAYWVAYPERFRRRPRAPQLPQPTGINTHLLSQAG
jgi:transposase InsO family protein